MCCSLAEFWRPGNVLTERCATPPPVASLHHRTCSHPQGPLYTEPSWSHHTGRPFLNAPVRPSLSHTVSVLHFLSLPRFCDRSMVRVLHRRPWRRVSALTAQLCLAVATIFKHSVTTCGAHNHRTTGRRVECRRDCIPVAHWGPTAVAWRRGLACCSSAQRQRPAHQQHPRRCAQQQQGSVAGNPLRHAGL